MLRTAPSAKDAMRLRWVLAEGSTSPGLLQPIGSEDPLVVLTPMHVSRRRAFLARAYFRMGNSLARGDERARIALAEGVSWVERVRAVRVASASPRGSTMCMPWMQWIRVVQTRIAGARS